MNDHIVFTENSAIQEIFGQLSEKEFEILLINLSTEDGFLVASEAKNHFPDEADKIAAMSSTIFALSDASTNAVLKDQCSITNIESQSGTLLFMATTYKGTPCVLTIAGTSKMALANLRFMLKRLASQIEEIPS